MFKPTRLIWLFGCLVLFFTACSGGNRASSTMPGTAQLGEVRHTKSVGDITVYTLPNGLAQPEGVTTAPDGSVWVAESFRNGPSHSGILAKFNSAGVLTEYTIPDQAGNQVHPFIVAVGPDGKIWFAAFSSLGPSAFYGSIKTDGSALTVYTYNATTLGHINGMTAGPDGNLWVTVSGCRGCNGLDKISTSGTFVPGVTLVKTPGWLITGPDNNLWFVEPNDNFIGRATTSGTLTEFPTGLSGYSPTDLVSDLNGIVFTATNGSSGRLAKMSTSGTLMSIVGVPWTEGNYLPVAYGGIAGGRPYYVLGTGMTQVQQSGLQTTFTIPDPNPQSGGPVPGITFDPTVSSIWYTDAGNGTVVKFSLI